MWLSFLTAITRGEHRLAPTTWVVAAAAALYSVWPLDIIPDLLLPFGIVDDLSLWAVVAVLLGREKARWEVARAAGRSEARDGSGPTGRASGGSGTSGSDRVVPGTGTVQ